MTTQKEKIRVYESVLHRIGLRHRNELPEKFKIYWSINIHCIESNGVDLLRERLEEAKKYDLVLGYSLVKDMYGYEGYLVGCNLRDVLTGTSGIIIYRHRVDLNTLDKNGTLVY